jgi:large repetitive protein
VTITDAQGEGTIIDNDIRRLLVLKTSFKTLTRWRVRQWYLYPSRYTTSIGQLHCFPWSMSGEVVDSGDGQIGDYTFPIGTTTVTYLAYDLVSDNEATCSFTITIEDNEPPTVLTQDITVELDAGGNASITPEMIDDGSFDNCGVAGLSLDVYDFTCADVGANTVTLFVEDVNGNINSAEATVTVVDVTPPVVVTQDITVELLANGTVTITPEMVDDGSNDACGIATLALSQTVFTCADVGDNTVTLTVTDNNGNVNTATAVVTVEDNIDPTVITQDITVELNADGEATITACDDR